MYCISATGEKLDDNTIKQVILNAEFEQAYFYVCTFITKRKLEGLHRKIIKQQSRNMKTLHLAPRGHGKSTVGDVDFCITKILREPNIRIMIGSKTQTQAEAFLGEVKAHFEMNEDLIRIFGDLKSKEWSNKEITVNTRTVIKKEATLTALGSSGAVVSKHFDIIIGDDLVGFENARTETQRTKLKEWFYSSLAPTLEPWGEMHILGTRYHPLDLYEDFIQSGKYHTVKQRALNTFSEAEFGGWRKYGLLDKDIKEGEQFSLWGKVFDIDTIQEIKEESGSIIFGMQYQNETDLAKGSIFKPQYFQSFLSYDLNNHKEKCFVTRRDLSSKEVKVYMGVDLAISEKESADYFVIFVIGIDDENNVYGLDYFKGRLSFDLQRKKIIEYAEKFNMVRMIGVEAVAYQQAMVGELRRTTSLPIRAIKTRVDKITRAMRRSAVFENKKVFLREDMNEFVEMLLMFPDVEHDDLFDGFDFACEVGYNKNKVIVRNNSINI
ncbi:MAG: phage terminase large subunit [Cetobacterium sp.]